MCEPGQIYVAVLLGAAIAGSPVAMRTVRERFSSEKGS